MKRILSLALATSLVMAPNAFAAVSDEDLAELRAQLATVSARLEELAAENARLKAAQEESATALSDVSATVADLPAAGDNWSDRIKLDGDFRYRYERIDLEGSDTRRRNRIRARTNIKAELSDNIDVGFGLATGGDDPVSTNQTLGGGGSSKTVVLNLAYVDWEAAEGLHLYAGKFKNPLTRVGGQPLTWDGDWTPEGLAAKYQRNWFFANALGTFLESDSRRSNDNFSWGGQFGGSGTIGNVKITGGLGYYSIPTQGESTTFGDPSDPGDFYGNTAVEAGGLPCGTTPDTECVYLYDYTLTQAFAEASFDVGEWPMLVYFDYVNNSDADDNDTGWTIGTKIGQAKDRGQMQFTYYYADKEADSMLGLLTDSDFGGGGTDSKGHWLQFNVGVTKSWTIGAQYFINEVDVASGNRSDFNRLMIDMQWKWK
ncbi:MAG: putative porin [Gammaproteobacteria bacterium]|nr:putative porin [Gammaproteobacteria bacterium]